MDVTRAYLATRQFIQDIPGKILERLDNPSLRTRLNYYSAKLTLWAHGSSPRQPSHFEVKRTEETDK
jgi:hypothetical protein